MKQITFAVAMFASAAYAAVPVIDQSSISARQDGGKTVVIGYTMNPASSGDTELAIVTVDVQTNYVENAETKWASIGGEHLTTLSGDVNKIVAHTQDYKHCILWNPTEEGLPEMRIDPENVRVEITAWATNAPPAYWVIDLTHPADRMADRYYPNAGQIPGTVTNDLYKTDRLVFRRIPAKGVTWKMSNHYVTLSYDYYMAVFETTGAQHSRMTGSSSTNKKPFVQRWYNFRGWSTWPESGHALPSGSDAGAASKKDLAAYRNNLGGIQVDMPTEAEWRFACAAGTSTAYNNGTSDAAGLAKVGWYSGNSGSALHEVGLKDPNNWGLYDMHGNAFEWCLDWNSTAATTPVWDPVGAASGTGKYRLGGYYGNDAAACSTWIGNHQVVNENTDRVTVRLAVVIP